VPVSVPATPVQVSETLKARRRMRTRALAN
jgi:hypothetical protein